VAWLPGDPWPSGRAGGASSPAWGDHVRLWIAAGLAPGNTFHMGPHDYANLDSGNVMGGAPGVARVAVDPSRLWVDLSCDVLDVQIAGGASSAQGVLSQPDAATLTCTLRDPNRIYDPFNRRGPFAYGGRSRLVPGTPVVAFAEVVTPADSAIAVHYLFSGTADSWGEDWTPRAQNRVAKLVATDETKRWARYDREEQPPVGAGDTTQQRVQRLVDYFQWIGTVEHAPASTVTLLATTLAQTGWELLNRTLDDELGYVYFTPDGTLRWVNRASWSERPPPVIVLGCPDVPVEGAEDFHDVIVDVSPAVIDTQIRNRISAARTGGTAQYAVSLSSMDHYGEYAFSRTDLGVATDTQAALWAIELLRYYAYPQLSLEDATLLPGISPDDDVVWNALLGARYVTDLVRIVWSPPDLPANVVDQSSRIVGAAHTITRSRWEVKLQLVATNALQSSGLLFHLGPHANDRLDSGWIMG